MTHDPGGERPDHQAPGGPDGVSAPPVRPDPISAALGHLHGELSGDRRGVVADYIPELGRADPSAFGMALVSLGGQCYTAGDAGAPFTIQSISKPFVLALALTDVGLDGVLDHVGAEPSGERFNAISLDPTSGRPDNPMINAGAIVTTRWCGRPHPEAPVSPASRRRSRPSPGASWPSTRRSTAPST